MQIIYQIIELHLIQILIEMTQTSTMILVNLMFNMLTNGNKSATKEQQLTFIHKMMMNKVYPETSIL